MNTRRPAIRTGTRRFSFAAVAARFVRGWGNLVTGLATGEKPLVRQVMGEARTLRVSVRVPMRDLEERAVPREICGLQVHERPLWASRKWLPAVCAQVAGACFAGLPGNPSKQLSIPDLCASCVSSLLRLPSPCACVYSSPSRRTPKCGRANPENRILRKTQEVRQTIQDRLFKVAWKEEETLPQAPVFQEFLESIHFFNFKVLIWTESSILAQDERWRRA